ncbi:hypothetical protein CHS0354_017540 [Potamilus streckersoni]|uniref:Uncharacterized protein n=1 Tax=Potamilus streckersoni TaxID=2493646 RepID=A0AAE0TG06_9BIVA|nr:hypothetical protein CHS0354_017540 [Potamilus streckersoni]
MEKNLLSLDKEFATAANIIATRWKKFYLKEARMLRGKQFEYACTIKRRTEEESYIYIVTLFQYNVSHQLKNLVKSKNKPKLTMKKLVKLPNKYALSSIHPHKSLFLAKSVSQSAYCYDSVVLNK